jgi:hypothetical protein
MSGGQMWGLQLAPLLRPMVGYSCQGGVWGCCAAHRRQASSYTDRIWPGVCALLVASNFLRNTQYIRTLENLRKQPPSNKDPQSPNQRRDLGRSESKGASAPSLHRRRFFCAVISDFNVSQSRFVSVQSEARHGAEWSGPGWSGWGFAVWRFPRSAPPASC